MYCFKKDNTMEVNFVSRELKGDNGQIVGSEDYFKRLNEDNKLTFYLRNSDSFDYYYDLRRAAKSKPDLGKPPYSDSYRTGKNKDRTIVIDGLKGISADLKRDLQNGIRNNDYIKDENAKNLIKAIEALDDCGIRCDCKDYVKKLSWYVGGDERKIRDLQKNLNDLRIRGDHGTLKEDGVYGRETLSAWLKFLDILEHGTVPTLKWIDPLEGHDIKFKITNSDHGINNVIANRDTNFQYYRLDPPLYTKSGNYKKVKIKGEWVDADFNHLNIDFPKPRTDFQRSIMEYDHLPVSDEVYKVFSNLDNFGKRYANPVKCCILQE